MANRLQLPTSPLLLGSNDDQLERAKARAARAAANRCRANTIAASLRPPPSPPKSFLSQQQIIDLLHNCVKLASENKINQKNTWELKLIDHLSEVIKVETENDTETNFQKASCTLEAGVKIYSIRVDSVHSEAYKVLGGINRASIENEQETVVEAESLNGKERVYSKKEPEKKVSPLSTLESSFEALNAKKLNVAFMVDPLYHQTSARFDEGGAKGLLLNNLGVYGGCCVLFDSFEVPSKCRSYVRSEDTLDLIDLSFVKESFEQMVINMQMKNEISPTLNEIVCHFDEANERSSESFCVDQNSNMVPDVVHNREHDLDNWQSDPWELNHDNETDVFKENMDSVDATFESNYEVNDLFASCQHDGNEGFDKAPYFLFQHVGFTTKKNSWAGPDHWKYQRPKGSEDSLSNQSNSTFSSNQFKVKRFEEGDLDFTAFIGKENPDIFASSRSPKTLLLPANRPSYCNRLPEDCHYQPQDLVKLFLLPSVMCLGRQCRKSTDNSSSQQNKCFGGAVQSCDNESVISGHYNEGYVCSDVEDSDELVSQPRRVNKIDVQYDRTSKQVDVQILKDNIWDKIQECEEASEMVPKDAVSFKHLFANVYVDWQAVGPEHLSPHLCFICLLHLANEHGLLIQDNPRLDDLSIHLPSSK